MKGGTPDILLIVNTYTSSSFSQCKTIYLPHMYKPKTKFISKFCKENSNVLWVTTC